MDAARDLAAAEADAARNARIEAGGVLAAKGLREGGRASGFTDAVGAGDQVRVSDAVMDDGAAQFVDSVLVAPHRPWLKSRRGRSGSRDWPRLGSHVRPPVA